MKFNIAMMMGLIIFVAAAAVIALFAVFPVHGTTWDAPWLQ